MYIPSLAVKSFVHTIFDCIPNTNGGRTTLRNQADIRRILLFSDSKCTKKQFFLAETKLRSEHSQIQIEKRD